MRLQLRHLTADLSQREAQLRTASERLPLSTAAISTNGIQAIHWPFRNTRGFLPILTAARRSWKGSHTGGTNDRRMSRAQSICSLETRFGVTRACSARMPCQKLRERPLWAEAGLMFRRQFNGAQTMNLKAFAIPKAICGNLVAAASSILNSVGYLSLSRW